MDPVNETENAMIAIAVRICVLVSEFSDTRYDGELDPDTGERDYSVRPSRMPIPVEEQQRKADAIRLLTEAHKGLACGLTTYLTSDVGSYCDNDCSKNHDSGSLVSASE